MPQSGQAKSSEKKVPNGKYNGDSSFDLNFKYGPTVCLRFTIGFIEIDEKGVPNDDGTVPCIVCEKRISKGITAYLNNGCHDNQMVGTYCQDHDDKEEIKKVILQRAQNQHLGRAEAISQFDVNTLEVDEYSGRGDHIAVAV